MTNDLGEITDYDIVDAMAVYGGHFAQAIAAAFKRADMDNYRRLKEAFPEMWEDYRNMAIQRQKILQHNSGKE